VLDIKLDPTSLVIRGAPSTVYDRQDLYARYGMSARIDRGILRLPAARIGESPLDSIERILDRALALRVAAPGGAPLAGTARS
jgi:hypothetical protein